MAAGFDDFLRKPFTENMIFDILTKHLGVQYIYEDLSADLAVEASLDDRTPTEIISAELEIMGAEWRSQIYTSTIEGDVDRIRQLIQEISATESSLKKVLEKLSHQYEFEQILNLIETAK
jgi:hypothetical protein